MTAADDLRDLEQALQQDVVAERLVLVSNPADPDEQQVRQGELTNEVAEQLGESFSRLRHRLERGFAAAAPIKVEPYDENHTPETGDVVTLDPSTRDELRDLFELLDEPDDIPAVAANIPWEDLELEARSAKLGQERVWVLRKIMSTSLLTTSRRAYLFFEHGQFRMVPRRGLGVDHGFDMVYWRGTLFVFNVQTFERVFRFFEGLRADAEAAVEEITANIKVEGLDSLVEAFADNLPQLRKLRRISKADYFPILTIAKLEKFAAKRDLAIKFEGTGAQRRINVDESNIRDLLTLLDDDFLRSQLTGKDYRVNDRAKKPI